MGYSAGDGVRQQFTLKERVVETGLDYFGARYYASTQGRFTSPDPILLNHSRLIDPQRLNRYGHARQNPLRFIDPDGEDLVPTNEASAAQLRADLDKLLTVAEAANIRVAAGSNITIIDPGAISKGSPAYNRLLDAIKPGVRREYTAVTADQNVTTKDGDVVNVESGLTVFEGPATGDNGLGATLIEIFVPTTDGPQVWGSDGTPIDLPRFIVTGHEALGHGTCGMGQCAVRLENQMREAMGLPTRSGSEHQTLPGERRPAGSQVPPTSVTTTANPDLIPPPSPPPQTYIVPKPPRKPNE